jgi:AbrB family looped-hinge helix DNA binding protein
MNAMLTIDKAGRIVLPKPVRDKLQLVAGDALELKNSGEEIVLRPVRIAPSMRKRDGIWVFNLGSPISGASIDAAIQNLREERHDIASHHEGDIRRQQKKPKARLR